MLPIGMDTLTIIMGTRIPTAMMMDMRTHMFMRLTRKRIRTHMAKSTLILIRTITIMTTATTMAILIRTAA